MDIVGPLKEKLLKIDDAIKKTEFTYHQLIGQKVVLEELIKQYETQKPESDK